MPAPTPLIKGMFVNSHIKRLRAEKGGDAVVELARRFGKPVNFKNLEDVPVREEVVIIELVLDLLSDSPVDPKTRAFEAGRLHFRNFITTPFGKILLGALPRTNDGFKKMMVSTGYIAGHVFKHIRFGSETAQGNMMISVMKNNDYPLDHFRGLFYEWMVFWELKNPKITATEPEPGTYKYVMQWT